MTHAYTYCDSTIYDYQKYGDRQLWSPKHSKVLAAEGGVNDARDLWDKLIGKAPNVHLVLSGHVLHNGTGYVVTPAADGHTVHQMLANYQAGVHTDDGAGGIPWKEGLPGHRRAFGGGGFLRLLQFHPDNKTVAVKTYSPWYDRWLTQPDQQFTLRLA
jgi:hypothetical protein